MTAPHRQGRRALSQADDTRQQRLGDRREPRRLLQLATGVRRWRSVGAQWAMVLSGGQSAIVGGLFISRSLADRVPGITDIAPNAGVGAFYFGVSALWLILRRGH